MSVVFGILGIAISLAALILGCIATGLPNWVSFEVLTQSVNMGIWKACAGDTCSDIDDFFSEVADEIQVTRAFMIIGCVFCTFAITAGILVTFVIKKSPVAYIAMGLQLFACACFLIAVAVFWDYSSDTNNKDNIDVSFWLGVATIFLAFIAAVFLFFAKPSNDSMKGDVV